jgi:transketolase
VFDGENNEGSIWEAAMAAPNLNLDNLYVVLDKNNFQQTGSNEEIMNSESLTQKWKSFSWDVSETNGHKIEELFNFFSKKSTKPKLLVANTIKGKGISFAENNNDWHHAVLTKKFYEQALMEIESNSK